LWLARGCVTKNDYHSIFAMLLLWKLLLGWGFLFLIKWLAISFGFLCFANAAHADVPSPSCDPHAGLTAADFSQDVTSIDAGDNRKSFDALKKLGLKTIIRYYDWPSENNQCKTLKPAESDAIIEAGFNIVTVFQYKGEDPERFLSRSHGAPDAKRALELAGVNGQPPGSAIYFAVDGVDAAMKDLVFEYSLHRGGPMSRGRRLRLIHADSTYRRHIDHYARFRLYHHRYFNKAVDAIGPHDLLPFIDDYFKGVNSVFKAQPEGRKFRVGAYGSGLVCEHLMAAKLVDYCWLSQSQGWPHFQKFYGSGKWSMVQKMTTQCKVLRFQGAERMNFDFNRVNPKMSDFGQWSKKVAASGPKDVKCQQD
jgi:Domain of unknown function (DUF1906)